jgi:hypothetical protein
VKPVLAPSALTALTTFTKPADLGPILTPLCHRFEARAMSRVLLFDG